MIDEEATVVYSNEEESETGRVSRPFVRFQANEQLTHHPKHPDEEVAT